MTKRQEIFLIVAILFVAAFLRLYRLDQLPPGLHYDEAFNATQAQKVLAGVERPLYFSGDLTEEPMAIYATSAFFALFGASPFSLRLVSAMVGILTVAVLYLAARHLFQSLTPALISAFALAILYWHINFSRLGMEPIFLPLVLTLGLWFLVRSFRALPKRVSQKSKETPPPGTHDSTNLGTAQSRLRSVAERESRWNTKQNWVDLFSRLEGGFSRQFPGIGVWAFAGVFLSGTLYTYKAALFVPILLVGLITAELLIDRDFVARNLRGLAIFLLAAVLAFAPLGLYWAAHPSEFIERPATVLVAPATLIPNALQVAGMFFLRGDENPRSNLPGRPVLDPILAIGFVIGIVVCLARFRRFEARLIILWLVVMVLPSVLSDFAPHFGRSIGATPAVALITGYGLTALIERIRSRFFAFSFLLLALAFGAYSTFHDYFSVWASQTGLYDSFDVGLLSLSQKLRVEPANESLFISPVDSNHYTIQFGLDGVESSSFNGRNVLPLPESGAGAAYGIVTREDPRSLGRLRKIFPAGRVIDTVYDFTAQPYALIFRTEGLPQIAPQKRVDARLGDNIALIGYDVASNGSEVRLTIYWGSIAEIREDYTVFVHLLDSSSQVVAQDDARPGHGTYLTPRWRAAQVIADDYRLVIPANTSPAEYRIEFGMYVLQGGTRVRMTDANGVRLENDRVLIERFASP